MLLDGLEWCGLFVQCISVMFLSAVWTLVLMANIKQIFGFSYTVRHDLNQLFVTCCSCFVSLYFATPMLMEGCGSVVCVFMNNSSVRNVIAILCVLFESPQGCNEVVLTEGGLQFHDECFPSDAVENKHALPLSLSNLNIALNHFWSVTNIMQISL